MKIRAKNGGQTVDITLPATDMDMQYCMKCIGIEDIVPVCCISEVWDEPSYFGFLKGQTVSMDELNFLARRLDGMTEYEKRVVGVYSSETGIREMKQLINLTYRMETVSGSDFIWTGILQSQKKKRAKWILTHMHRRFFQKENVSSCHMGYW